MASPEKIISDIIYHTNRVESLRSSMLTAFAKKGFSIGMTGAILDLMNGEIEEARAVLKSAERKAKP